MRRINLARFFVFGVIFTLFFSWLESPLFAASAYEFRKKVIDRYEGDDSTSMTIMKLQKIVRAKDGNVRVKAERVRMVKRFTKAYGKDDKVVMFFLEPADIRGTGFLSFIYDDKDKDNDQWLYLPTLKKIKRIASSDKSGSFMGTDFSYVDISDIKVDDYKHRFLQDDELKKLMKDKSVSKILKKKFGKSKAAFAKAKAWMMSNGLKVVESIPVNKKVLNDNGYSRMIYWIDPGTLIIDKSLYFGKNKKAFKLRESIKKEKIQDIWTYMEMIMENFNKNHRTVIYVQDTKYNTGVKDNYFTQRTLEQGL